MKIIIMSFIPNLFLKKFNYCFHPCRTSVQKVKRCSPPIDLKYTLLCRLSLKESKLSMNEEVEGGGTVQEGKVRWDGWEGRHRGIVLDVTAAPCMKSLSNLLFPVCDALKTFSLSQFSLFSRSSLPLRLFTLRNVFFMIKTISSVSTPPSPMCFFFRFPSASTSYASSASYSSSTSYTRVLCHFFHVCFLE